MQALDILNELIRHSLKAGEPTGPHITRYSMYKRMAGCLTPYDEVGKIAITISGSTKLAEICGLKKSTIRDMAFPEYDVLNLPFEENSIDFIISDQILEHVAGDIPKLYRDLAKILKPGGVMVHATPFLTEVHNCPVDCWRFTPNGLKWLADQSGMTVLSIDSWGSRVVWMYIALGYRFSPVPLDPDHPINRLAMKNEADWPITVWIICQKPAA